ncbi:MAG: transglutaminase-like domain-containing protein [Planctomycetaceae bacterium]
MPYQAVCSVLLRACIVAWSMMMVSMVHAEDEAPAASDADAAPAERLIYDSPRTQRWQIGLKLDTNGVTCNEVLATFPVPTDWPEQTVKVVSQQIDPSVSRWDVRDLPGGARQIVLTIPRAVRGSDPEILFEMDVTRSRTLAPEKTDDLVVPVRPSTALKLYLGNSPHIDTTDARIRNAAKEFAQGDYADDWTRVEAIYDWVREKVEYVEGDIKTASQALRDGKGDCEELTSLFVAICRANRIPARMVWIPDHCYPEFYLEDASGNGYWFPCQAAGTRQFGSMDEYRPVLQKGDRFKLPEKKQPVRYVAEFFRCLPEGKRDPKPEFIRQVINE